MNKTASKFKHLENIATADAAYEAYGDNLSKLFVNSAIALQSTLLDPSKINPKEETPVDLKAESVEDLLYEWLNFLIFQSSFERLVYKNYDITVVEEKESFLLKGIIKGEKIDPKKHKLRTEVKAVTLYQFEVGKGDRGWKARFVLDI